MTLPVYLAMTAAEISARDALPAQVAYMACHFSPYGTGLSNQPDRLPEGAILILNDRIPICAHDPDRIAQQVKALCEQLPISAVLLDLQRQEEPQAAGICEEILSIAQCPVAVSEWYARDFGCPVFLSPPPLYIPLETHLAPWKGREIWLEAALDGCKFTVTEHESSITTYPAYSGDLPFRDEQLYCHYGCKVADDRITFTLHRTQEDLTALLEAAENLGITKVIGLYQELGSAL